MERLDAISPERFHDDMVIIDKEEFLRYPWVLASPENFPDYVSIGIGRWKFIRMINLNESFQSGRLFPNDKYLADIGQILKNRPERKPDLVVGPVRTGAQDINNISRFHTLLFHKT
jgi:hypothetical protein